MPIKSGKIRTILFIYWFLLLYILAALIWWFIALNQQNIRMNEFKIQRLDKKNINYSQQYTAIINEEKRKKAQYAGEGFIFLLLISAGAIFLFRTVNKQLKTSIQQQNFMMAITHELKTPIAVTKLNLETLQKRKLDEIQQEKLIGNTLQETNRMNALCNNLLLSSQMEAGGYKYTMEKTNFSELINNCVNDFISRYPQRNFLKKINENIFISGDLFLLQMAVNNLIDNAVKYSGKETMLEITLTDKHNSCELCIIDQGLGIDNSEKKKIFEKYYRTGSEATQKSKGTGLGLFLVKKIIDNHKGGIKVVDNLPKGSTFIIELKTVA